MKNLTLCALAVLLFSVGCKKDGAPQEEGGGVADEPQEIVRRSCAADEVLQAQLKADPAMRERIAAIEDFTQRTIRSGKLSRLVNGTIQIPVVVHVVYNTTAQNINDLQVKSQIDVLNEDYQNLNADRNNLPLNSFQSVASKGLNVRFVLSKIVHKFTSTKSFTTNDAVKSGKRGGDDPVDPTLNLNIWSCNLSNGVLGYAQFPGGPAQTDGVVILYSAFGSRAKYPKGTFVTRYDLGRTATHEVGHWMNLRHIWGDDNGACTGSDQVADTPNQAGENYGCPSFPHVSCGNSSKGDMFMNYMDYTDDKCMYMFSALQSSRALAVFATGGPRAAMGK